MEGALGSPSSLEPSWYPPRIPGLLGRPLANCLSSLLSSWPPWNPCPKLSVPDFSPSQCGQDSLHLNLFKPAVARDLKSLTLKFKSLPCPINKLFGSGGPFVSEQRYWSSLPFPIHVWARGASPGICGLAVLWLQSSLSSLCALRPPGQARRSLHGPDQSPGGTQAPRGEEAHACAAGTVPGERGSLCLAWLVRLRLPILGHSCGASTPLWTVSLSQSEHAGVRDRSRTWLCVVLASCFEPQCSSEKLA